MTRLWIARDRECVDTDEIKLLVSVYQVLSARHGSPLKKATV